MIISALTHILSWYEHHGRHGLPWRFESAGSSLSDAERAYRVWLSEILLQQTQVNRVIPFYERILEKFPTIHHLAHTSYEEFFPYYKGMGYYSRARNMLATARTVSSVYGGEFPRESSALQKLPGVGKYTSEAIRAFAYNIPTLAWDTNLEKVFSRLLHGSRFLSLSPDEKTAITTLIFSHFTSPSSHINASLMDWSSLVDLNNKELIDPLIYVQCGKFYETGGKLEEKTTKNTSVFPIPDAYIIVILHRDHTIYFTDPGKSTYDLSLPHGILPSISEYIPFILPPTLSRDTRGRVQQYFLDTYNLEVSVRPIHKKGFTESGIPYVVVNAQIQTGVYNFIELRKKERIRMEA